MYKFNKTFNISQAFELSLCYRNVYFKSYPLLASHVEIIRLVTSFLIHSMC